MLLPYNVVVDVKPLSMLNPLLSMVADVIANVADGIANRVCIYSIWVLGCIYAYLLSMLILKWCY